MKTYLRHIAFAATLSLAAAGSVRAQGSLTPPPGPPAPVMKTIQEVWDKASTVEAQNAAQNAQLAAIQTRLNAVEAQIPLVAGQPGVTVDGATGAITISAAGSYFLTGHLLSETANHGITIASSDVALNLNGFSVRRLTGTPGNGIHISSGAGITIRNGSIVGGTTVSGNTFTKAGWNFGIANTTGNPVRVSDVSVRGTRDTGIDVGTAIPSVVERCNTDTCGGGGISAQIVTGCVARKSAGGGIFTGFNSAGRVTGCYGETLGSVDGIFAEGGVVVQSFGISAGGNGISGATVADSQGTSTSGSGIMATYAANNCTGFSTDSAGIFSLGAATNCSGTSENSTGVFARTATNCYASSTGGTGLLVITVAQNCTGFSLLGRGLVAESASNCYGSTSQGTFGMEIAGTASFCRGSKPTGTAIKAAIAIGCTTDGGSVLAPQKHLGTP